MKALFLTCALLLISAAQGQDFSFINSANKADEATAKTIAQNIASNAQTKYRLYKFIENERTANMRSIFAPESLTNDQIREQGNFDNCLIVDFTIYYEGKNADLQKPGIKTYKLREVSANYLDLFPSWQKYFKPEATAEKTTTDFKSQELKDFDKKIDFRMQKNVAGNDWKLLNRS